MFRCLVTFLVSNGFAVCFCVCGEAANVYKILVPSYFLVLGWFILRPHLTQPFLFWCFCVSYFFLLFWVLLLLFLLCFCWFVVGVVLVLFLILLYLLVLFCYIMFVIVCFVCCIGEFLLFMFVFFFFWFAFVCSLCLSEWSRCV